MCDFKVCCDCGEKKPVEEFTALNYTRQDGTRLRRRYCKVCSAAHKRATYHADPEHRARQVIHAMNAQPRHKGQRLPVDEAARVLLGATRCTYCGQPNDGSVVFALDHVQPVKLGGTNTMDNVTPCCEPCNRAKHDMPAAEYLAWLRGVVKRNAS